VFFILYGELRVLITSKRIKDIPIKFTSFVIFNPMPSGEPNRTYRKGTKKIRREGKEKKRKKRQKKTENQVLLKLQRRCLS
jgi:hypothetical protein